MNEYRIAVAENRTVKYWQNTSITWDELKKRLTAYVVTHETAKEYKALTNKERGDTKDVGGFVGGHLGGKGERTKQNIEWRSLITIDIDKAPELPDLSLFEGLRYILYSTHSHTPEAPCVRIVVPLTREVTPLEYRAVTHYLCGAIGLAGIDMSCCEPERLMFYPSIPCDVEPITRVQEGVCLDPDEVLSNYNNWRDPAEWAGVRDAELRQYMLPETIVKESEPAEPVVTSPVITTDVGGTGLTADDPMQKSGIVGAWCRAVSIYEALAICSHVYEPTRRPDRYTYKGSDSVAGVVVYDDRWVYSNHSNKDPNAGKLLNSFDLVRLVLFGSRDEGTRARIVTNLPSYEAMCDYAMQNPKVKGMLSKMDMEEANRVYGIEVVYNGTEEEKEQKEQWLQDLDELRDAKTGILKPSVMAFSLILQNDPRLIRDKVVFNEFSNTINVVGDLLWRQDVIKQQSWTDTDMACLELEMQRLWKLENKGKTLRTAFFATMGQPYFRINPVVEFLHTSKWDGVSRVDTLFIDYLGVPDTPLHRAITRKTLVACVARVLDPGCKYDQITILTGVQGIGKSSLIYKLGGEGEWVNDGVDLNAPNNKLEESIVGSWLVEIPELQGYHKKDMESMKSFISKRQDKFRGAYREFAQVHKRTCVFFGTTNEEDILRDLTGNRRFWILPCSPTPREDVWSLTQEQVMQIWAEALIMYKGGEPLTLPKEMTEALAQQQKDFDATQSELAELAEWLDTLLPDASIWKTLTKEERRMYFTKPYMLDSLRIGGAVRPRDEVCAAEIVNEYYGDERASLRGWLGKTITQMMSQIEGWERGKSRKRMGVYGIQTYFKRVEPWSGSEVDGKLVVDVNDFIRDDTWEI